MEVVKYNIARKIKKMGFPQPPYGLYYKENGEPENGFDDLGQGEYYAPTYIEVWLWLWRLKIIELSLTYGKRINDVDEQLYCLPLKHHDKSHPNMKHIIQEMNFDSHHCCSMGYKHNHADPEKAIINSIDYLFDYVFDDHFIDNFSKDSYKKEIESLNLEY